jgi:2-oxoglutarate dehydrogenase E2 component (dihydrolipoamide succinyltransferase)
MGESVAEGTIVRWIRKVGDVIGKDEPLFEISTDKVDAEIPSPDAGVLVAIHVQEGETVPVNSVVAVIGSSGTTGTPGTSGTRGTTGTTNELTQSSSSISAKPDTSLHAAGTPRPAVSVVPGVPDARLRSHSSPVVRKIAAAHAIDIGRLQGTGISGRVTRRDIEAFVRGQEEARRGVLTPTPATAKPAILPPAAYATGDNVRIEKMSIMRRKIAEHMLASVQTSPHVYSAVEVDFSRVDALRRSRKAEYDAAGVKLTYTAFVARAAIEAIRECPFINASVDGENVVFKQDINLGIAVALEQGLIVPVIRHADRLSMKELCGAIQDIASRARAKQLKVDEVQGGTFTITNPGVFGGLWGLPIINQPQVAILAVGSVGMRAVVVDGAVVARPMCYFTLGHDHRLIDGAEGGRFLQTLKTRIQEFDEARL